MITAEFNEVYAIGIDIIDRQHRRFFEILGRLVAARAAGEGRQAVLSVLDEMVDYVDEHFSAEESYMREFGYAEFAAHRRLHAGFVTEVMHAHRAYRDGNEHLDDELLEYLGHWFTMHIRREDPKYVELFRANGL
ncbi:MAG: bacteriohemerythrin [Candidatus Krumholzibacteriia bacterium]